MVRTVVLEELHVTVRIPAALPGKAAAAVRRRVRSEAFRRAVERAVLAALGPRARARASATVSR